MQHFFFGLVYIFLVFRQKERAVLVSGTTKPTHNVGDVDAGPTTYRRRGVHLVATQAQLEEPVRKFCDLPSITVSGTNNYFFCHKQSITHEMNPIRVKF